MTFQSLSYTTLLHYWIFRYLGLKQDHHVFADLHNYWARGEKGTPIAIDKDMLSSTAIAFVVIYVLESVLIIFENKFVYDGVSASRIQK